MIAPVNPTLREFLEFYARLKLDLKKSSLGQYHTLANLMERAAGRPLSTRDAFSLDFATDFRLWLKERGRANTTINSKCRELRTLWRVAHRKGWAGEPPDREELPRLKELKRTPKGWSLEKMERLVAACHRARPVRRPQVPMDFDGRKQQIFVWEGRHWVALILTIYDTALRIGAVLRLRVEQLDFAASAIAMADYGAVSVEAEQQKDGEEAAFSLHPSTVAAIADSLDGRGVFSGCDLLFPWPLNRRSIWPHLEAILRDAGLECGRRDKFHRVRRTSASHAEHARSGTAQQHLGHSDFATTRRYLDPEIVGTLNVAALLPRFDSAARDPQRRLF